MAVTIAQYGWRKGRIQDRSKARVPALGGRICRLVGVVQELARKSHHG